MRNVKLGNSNIHISTIGLGCWQFSKPIGFAGMYWGEMKERSVNEIVAVSLEYGVNWFDTAEIYGLGTSEKALSHALQENKVNPGQVIVATKWNPVFRFGHSIQRTFSKRIENLDPYPVDLYQVHNPASFSSVRSQMKAMAALQKDNQILTIGVSNFSLSLMRKAQEVLVGEGLFLASNQMPFSLLNRRIERNGVMNYAKDQGITIIAYSPLAQGILSGKYHQDPGLIKSKPGFRRFLPNFNLRYLQKTLPLIDLLRKIALKYQATPAQVALRWVIQSNSGIVVAIPGAANPEQARQNAQVMKMNLDESDMRALDELSWQIQT